MMRLVLVAAIVLLGLTGCAGPMDDLLGGRYSEVDPMPARPGLTGMWTGSMGPYLVTLEVEPDGTGLYCYSWNEKHAVNRLKYDGERLVFQDGSMASIIDLVPDKLIIRPDYSHASRATLRPDEGLVEASPYCAKAMQ